MALPISRVMKSPCAWFAERPRLQGAVCLFVLAAMAFTLATLAIDFTRSQGRIAAIWLVNGIAVALILWRSKAAWPYMLCALSVSLFAANVAAGDNPGVALFLSFANALEVFLVSYLFTFGRRPKLFSLAGVIRLIAAATVGCVASTAFAISGLALFASTVTVHDAAIWLIADMLGIILFTPVMHGIIKRSNNLDVFRFGRDQILTFVLACAVAFLVFAQSDYPFLFFVPPALVAVAFTSGIRGSSISLLTTTAISLPFVLADQGPTSLMNADMETKVLVLQSFLIVNSVLTFAVAGAVTERRRLLSHLERSRVRLRSKTRDLREMLGKARLAEVMSKVGHWTLEPETNAVFWSPEVYAIHGVDPESFDPNYNDAIQFFEESDRQLIRDLISRGMETGAGWEFEATLIRKSDGERRIVHSIGECLTDADGNVENFFGVFRDITDQKNAEKEMAEREQQYRMLAEHSTDIVLNFDLDGTVRFVSPSCRVLGIKPEDVIGQSAQKFVHPDDNEIAAKAVHDLINNTDPNKTIRSEHRAPKAGGGYVWLESNPTLIRDENGVPRSIVSSYRDVTERKQMEQQLQESERKHRMLAEHSTDIVLQTTKGGVITYASPSAVKLGVLPEDAIGMRTLDFVIPEDRAFALELSRQNYAGIEPDPNLRREYRVHDSEGNVIWLEGNPTVVRDETGEVVSVINTLRDVTDRREREDMLAAAREEAEAASRAKAEFLSNMSHEIRTPLNGVLGFTQLIARTELDQDQKQYLERIQGAGRMLREIVDDILDFSKIEAGQLVIEDNAFCVRSMLSDTIGLIDAGRKNKSVPIHQHIDPFADMAIMADETRVRQVLTNLIGNAAKFTPSGRIDVSAAIRQDKVQIVVEDTGIGVSKANLETIFEGFRQADATITRRFGGTGLGLSISRTLTELMGGTLEMESEEGKGTRVTFTLPLKRAESCGTAVETPSMPVSDSTKATIVVVDDVEANLSLIELGLKHTGHQLFTFESARKAIDFIRAAERVDLVLMDVQMPDMDGVTATRVIRGFPEPRCHVPVIALTANALPSQIAGYKEAGMDDHFAKPVDLDRLEALVDRHIAAADEISSTRETVGELSSEADEMAELRAEYADYLSSLGDEFSEILSSNSLDVAQRVARLAHAVAGTAGSFGFEEVSRAAFALEEIANEAARDTSADVDIEAGIAKLTDLGKEAA